MEQHSLLLALRCPMPPRSKTPNGFGFVVEDLEDGE
jgi:hypothetical protein